jgi:uncharacterized protein
MQLAKLYDSKLRVGQFMVFGKGHCLRLDLEPRDGVGSLNYSPYHADYKTGYNILYSRPERPPGLLLPIIPAA